MDRLSQRLDQLTPLQRAVFALKESQAKLEALEQARTEPIAVVGMACRFPGGADSPDAFWDLLLRGGDGIVEVPAERWDADDYFDPDPTAPGKTNSRWGGFLERIDGFDKQFFGVSEREATRMDPQQRLMLELAWEAFEDAGIPPDRLAGSPTGVFVGIAGSDYCLFQVGDPRRSDAYASTGTAICIAANRVSFTFDLRGPSLALDTACSSSLVAVHQACQSLRRGESTLALAGGVNIMLCPTTVVSLTKAGLSSPDGRCRSFDARAEGYVRGEGGGLVVLKPLSRALADGDPIHAVIRGSAVNQDGQSNGMKTPNRQAQEALLREAYGQAGIDPAVVRYVEAQGTGTLMGDMIEGRALGHVLSAGRSPDSPCYLGSVKTNIGHLEAASGIAGLIKTVLALKHRTIPANLHFETPNPHLPFDELRLRVATGTTAWPDASGPATAGVSALGFGGTNAHVVLQEASSPVPSGAETSDDGPVLIPVSARHEAALKALALALRDRLDPARSLALRDVASTLGAGRAHHDHRLAIVAGSREEARRRLDAFARGEPVAGVFEGRKPYDHRPRAAFVFSEDSSLWREAARGLRDEEAAFRSVLDECAEVIRSRAGWSLAALVDAEPADPRWDDPKIAFPAVVAFQIALKSLWRSWGIEPVAVVGFGAGEASAAWAAGILTLEETLRVAIHRAADREPLGTIQPRTGSIPLLSPADGRDLDGSQLSAGYWSGREAGEVDVAAAVDALAKRQPDAILEVGPPTLAASVVTSLQARRPQAIVTASLAPGAPWRVGLLEALAVLYASGHPFDWSRLHPEKRRHVSLPSYPWQRERCWLDGETTRLGITLGPVRDHADHGNGQPAVSSASSVDHGSEWLYELRWEPLDQDAASTRSISRHEDRRRWLILGDASGVGERLAELLEERGDDATIVSSAWSDPRRAIVDALGEDPSAWDGVVHLWSLDIPDPETRGPAEIEASLALGCGSTLALLRALARSQDAGGPRLWLGTRGVHTVAGSPASSPAQAPLWGLGRTLAQEHARHRGGLIDLDPDAALDEAAGSLLAEIDSIDGEDQVAWRAGRRHVARLVRGEAEQRSSRDSRFRADGSYLVTGGLGGVGRGLCRWMVEQGARRLILLGRTPLPPRSEWSRIDREGSLGKKIQAVLALEALGASVHLAAVDVADEAALAAFLETYRAEGWPPIRGVFHLAGTSDFAPLVDLDPGTLTALCRPKLVGGWMLHRLLADEPLEQFVLFSSAVSILGSPLLGGFGAACASLDALAEYRAARGLPATSINWGAWSSSGEPRPSGEATMRRGIREFTKPEALALLGRVLDQRSTGVVAMPYTADDWVRQPPIPLDSPILKGMDLPTAESRPVQPRPELKTPYEAPRTELERWMAALWAEILKLDRVGIHDNFFELGGDSLQGAVLLNRIQAHFQEILHLLALFETPHIAGLAAYLRQTYPADIRRLCPAEDLGEPGRDQAPAGRPDFIGRSEIESMRQAISTRMLRQSHGWTHGPKNPRAVFLLSPPRSGSTLLRVMLAGHPRLFVPPELYLLHFNTLADRRRANEGPDSYRLEGGIRALMEAMHCDGPNAQQAMRRLEDEATTTQEFYRQLQHAIGDRIFVDKTPAYAMDLEVLKRAEVMFEEPLYIHLLRHPCGMIRSYDEYRLAQIWTGRFEHPYSPRQLGEMVWVNNHENILTFLEGVADDRQFRLKFEDLVRRPEAILRDVCRFLNLDYEPAMAQPYEDRERRMVDGIAPESRMLGDQKFSLKHQAIDPSVADRWKEEMTGDFLGPPAREVAERLGYSEIAPPLSPPSTRDDRAPIERVARHEEADDLLEKLDELSDVEVEALLERELSDVETAHE